MDEYEFILEDRIAKIQAINKQYDLEHNAYIAFSGGKDSTVLSHLIDLALPGNKIPRVYVNTGIEYVEMVKFVKAKAKIDSRIVIINNKLNIPQTLKEKGYPFKSKDYSQKCKIYFKNQKEIDKLYKELKGLDNKKLLKKWEKYAKKVGIGVVLSMLGKTYQKKTESIVEAPFYKIPSKLLYQFSNAVNDLSFKISDKCCLEFKEKPSIKYSKDFNRPITITGLMREEGGRRTTTLCTAFDKKSGKLKSFAPLSIISKQWENQFIEKEGISLCKLYYPPYNLERTGCKGCPFDKNIKKDLLMIYQTMPNEYKQCLHLWKPVYDEYIKINFRLDEYPHKIFNKNLKKLF